MNMGIAKASDASMSCNQLIPGLNGALQVLTTIRVHICIFGVAVVLFVQNWVYIVFIYSIKPDIVIFLVQMRGVVPSETTGRDA